jgi:hypothetical protein
MDLPETAVMIRKPFCECIRENSLCELRSLRGVRSALLGQQCLSHAWRIPQAKPQEGGMTAVSGVLA